MDAETKADHEKSLDQSITNDRKNIEKQGQMNNRSLLDLGNPNEKSLHQPKRRSF
jgi:hypothetical protein